MKVLKLISRTLLHYGLYSIINLLGLTLSLTCVVIISRYVYSELTVEGFNKHLERLFITTSASSDRPGRLTFSGIDNPNNEKSFVDLSQNPGVEKHSRFFTVRDDDIVVNDQTYAANLLVTDTVFMQITGYLVVAGAPNILHPEDVLISESFAAKIFGKENPLGKTFIYPAAGDRTLTVTGIIGTPASKSILSFDLLVSLQLSHHWSRTPISLMLLYPGVNYGNFNRQYEQFMERKAQGTAVRYRLFPCKDIYFDKQINDYYGFAHGNLSSIFILSGIGVLLLLTGVVNYLNIQSIVMTRRNKELGMKKVFGAEGKKIFVQLLLENLTLILLSLLVAFGLASAAHPFVENILDIRQRRKEIAIRKVNGALMKDIISLLLRKYFALLGIAFAIATPVALFVIHKYLENFTFKAPVSWWLFAVALLVTVVLSMLTLLGQASKASRENPAEVIKSE
jgi:ABC-type antimicrobial peptide transport system permease subunit